MSQNHSYGSLLVTNCSNLGIFKVNYIFTFLINCCSFVVEGVKLEIEATRIFGCCGHISIMFNTNVVGSESAPTSTFSSISRLLVNKVLMALASMVYSWNQR